VSNFVSFVSGVIFSVGLALSGMTQPSKVVGFLDVSGQWDATLLCVMASAVAVYFVANRLALRRTAPFLAARFSALRFAPTQLDAPLILGSALFGIGWGISGFCPGPAVASAAAAVPAALLFMPGMLAGMLLYRLIESRGAPAPAGKTVP
jgi:uncharacterized membrane protein YedE/YeeE